MVAVLGAPADPAELRALAGRADSLEIRADRIGDPDPQSLRRQFPGALVYTLRSAEEGALVNRSVARGQFAGRLLALPFVPLAEFSPAGFTLLVHATPVTDRVPVPLAGLSPDATVLELVYASVTTALVGAASACGLATVDGWDVLAAEVAMQFELITGMTMPHGAAADRRVGFPVAEHAPAAPWTEQSR